MHCNNTADSKDSKYALYFNTLEALRLGLLQSVCYRVKQVWKRDMKLKKKKKKTKVKTEHLHMNYTEKYLRLTLRRFNQSPGEH